MSLAKFFIVLIACNSLLLSFCSANPVPQFGPNSHPSCQAGFSFVNGMCAPIRLAQPAQCTTSCCQTSCQPPCQQPCAVQMQMPMQVPMQAPIQMQMPIPMQVPVPVPVPVLQPPPFLPPPFQPPPFQPPPLHPPPWQSPPSQPPPWQPPPFQPPPSQPLPSQPPPSQPPPSQPPPSQPTFTQVPNTTSTQQPTSVKCPNGTISIDGSCRLVYCGIGVYRGGKCIQTICPQGTIWDGQSCKIPEAHNHTTVLLSTVVITNNVNQSQVNHGINYTNNLVIDITESPSDANQVVFSPKIVVLPPPPPQVHITSPPRPPVRFIPHQPHPPHPPPPPQPPQMIFVPPAPPALPPPPPPLHQMIFVPPAPPALPPPPPPPQPPQVIYISSPSLPVAPQPPPQGTIMLMPSQQPPVAPSCCTITTPNACLWEDQYVCRSQSYQQCGSICSQGNLNLIPRVVRQPPESCINSDCGYNQQPFYPDCSRCTTGESMTRSYCQTYCQSKSCNSCKTFDLSNYCENYPGAIACRPEYGYIENSDSDIYD